MGDLKRLLNDPIPEYHHQSRPRYDEQFVDLSWNHFAGGGSGDGGELTDLLAADFGNTSLDGTMEFDFDSGSFAEELNGYQQWADDAEVAGESSSSSPGDSDTVMSNNTPQLESSTVITTEGSNDVNNGNVCYGMLHNADVKVAGDMALLDEKLKPTQTTTRIHRFNLKESADHIQLTFPDGTELGVLRTNLLKGLSSLLGSSSIHFEAVAHTDTIRDTIGRVTKAADALVRVNINIYGPPDRADDIGWQLSEHKLWLQKPEQSIAQVAYKNPHILEFEDLDMSLMEQTINSVQSNNSRPVPRTEEEHLRQTVAEVYSSTRRQDELTQSTASELIKTPMLEHQKKALNFMLQRETGDIDEQFRLWKEVVVNRETKYQHKITKSLSRTRPDEKGGGILADEMGMGKSLSILSLIVETLEKGQTWASARKAEGRTGLRGYTRSTLIVVSSALLINNWCNEIEEHLVKKLGVVRYHGPYRPKDQAGVATLVDSDIVITTYNTLAKEWSTPAHNKTSLLHSIEWFRVVLDEAHIIRRQATTFYKTCAALQADSRWCLTGTPIQNKLEDIGALFCFIKAKPFHDMRQFRNRIVIPYDQGDDVTAIQRLVDLNDSLCLRRTRDLIKLPKLNEKVRKLDFDEKERKQYEKTKATLLRKLRQKVGEHEQTSKFGLFQVQLQLRILCNHGTYQKHFSCVNSQRDANEAILSSGVGNVQINCNGCQWPMPVMASNKVYNEFVEKCQHVLCFDCLEEAATSQDTESGQKHCPLCNTPQAVAAKISMAANRSTRSHNNTTKRGEDGELADQDYFNNNGTSTKMKALIRDVQEDLENTKSIIFSCWTRTLNLVERHLKDAGVSFSRIDGECPLSKRQKILDDFRQETGDRILLMTTGTGAFGLNLTCANRVFIVELQWNPSVESQAIARAIRLGQSQHVTVIRYIINNSVEQDMRAQQKRKMNMAKQGFIIEDENEPEASG